MKKKSQQITTKKTDKYQKNHKIQKNKTIFINSLPNVPI